jgi:4-amino-4-deoxy-L-arabinose transferase-like glycosyltransferase
MRYLLWSIVLAILLTTVTLISRPLLPVDETRYLSVAWEARLRGDFLVSHLNGEPYSHKPPLLFWLINAIWSFTGVNGPAARMVAPASGILCLLLTRSITKRLWPGERAIIACAPVIHISLMLWIVFCPVTMFDTLLTCCAMASLYGVLMAADGQAVKGWLIAGIGMGLGILTKGPVVLVHVLPAIVFAPWWAESLRGRRLKWYLGCGAAVAVAAVIGLSWAISSAISGGEPYATELLFGQTAGRMVNSFAHRQPFWWYLPWLPLCLMPWISFGAVWRGLRNVPLDRSLKFLLTWAMGSLVILSFVSGKQIYYLLPMLPPCAMILARLATSSGGTPTAKDLLFIVPGTIGMGLLPIVMNHQPQLFQGRLVNLLTDTQCVPLVICGVVLLLFRWKSIESSVVSLSACTVGFMAIVIGSISASVWDGFDLQPMARFASTCERPLAWFGTYHGQLNFLGEIPSIPETPDVDSLQTWLQENPSGAVIIRVSESDAQWADLIEFLRPHDRREPPAEQSDAITATLSRHPDFPLSDQKPRVLYAQRVRRGLTFEWAMVVAYQSPG